jgi:putative flippase GtrA
MRKLLVQFTRFGLVGFVGLIVDFGVFNLLRATVFNPDVIHEGPVFAKIISTTLAVIVNWIGNRHWTFREHKGKQLLREGVEYGIVSVGGLAIGLGCLYLTHYVLGYTSLLADNISSNVLGLALGTAFRFALYRLWVFSPRRGEREPALFDEGDTGSVGADADVTTQSTPVITSADLSGSPTPSSRPDPASPVATQGGTAPAAAARRSD